MGRVALRIVAACAWVSGLFKSKKTRFLKRDVSSIKSIFAPPPARHISGEGESYLADDCDFKGTVIHRGTRLVISGSCAGELRQTRRGASLFVNDGAHINGVLVTTNLEMDGQFAGSIDAQAVVIGSSATVQGEIVYESLSFSGQLKGVLFKHKEYRRPSSGAKGVSRI